jgi:hypothetical protein
VVAGYRSRRLISVQSVVVVASCSVVLATAADPSVPTAATAIAVTAALLAAATVVVVLRRALERAAAEARAHATIDPLTAAVNRRGLEDAAVALLHDGRRRAQTVGGDHARRRRFQVDQRRVRHQAGDRVIQEVCAAIRSCMRSEDIVARLWGRGVRVLTVLPPADIAELGELSGGGSRSGAGTSLSP